MILFNVINFWEMILLFYYFFLRLLELLPKGINLRINNAIAISHSNANEEKAAFGAYE